jgi:hypothetical protein
MHSKLEELKNQMAWALVRGSSIPSKYESKSVFILFVYLSGVMHNRYIVADLANQLNTYSDVKSLLLCPAPGV